MLFKILRNKKMARTFYQKTSSKYTMFNRVNNLIFEAMVIVLFTPVVSDGVNFLLLVFLPIYLVILAVTNALDLKIRVKQFKEQFL